MKFQGDMLNYCDFIQVFIFTTKHHLNNYMFHFNYGLIGTWHTAIPCSSRIINEMLFDIHTFEKCCFLKSITHSEMI